MTIFPWIQNHQNRKVPSILYGSNAKTAPIQVAPQQNKPYQYITALLIHIRQYRSLSMILYRQYSSVQMIFILFDAISFGTYHYKNHANHGLPSQYQTPYRYHPIIVSGCNSVWHKIVYQVWVWYMTWHCTIMVCPVASSTADHVANTISFRWK